MTDTQASPTVGPNADARALQRHLYREIGISAVAAALAIDATVRKSAAAAHQQANRTVAPRHAAA